MEKELFVGDIVRINKKGNISHNKKGKIISKREYYHPTDENFNFIEDKTGFLSSILEDFFIQRFILEMDQENKTLITITEEEEIRYYKVKEIYYEVSLTTYTLHGLKFERKLMINSPDMIEKIGNVFINKEVLIPSFYEKIKTTLDNFIFKLKGGNIFTLSLENLKDNVTYIWLEMHSGRIFAEDHFRKEEEPIIK